MTADTAESIEGSRAKWGHLGLALNIPEGVYHVVTWSRKTERNFVATEGWSAHDAGQSFKGGDGQGLWYRGTAELHDRAHRDSIRGQSTPVTFMQEQVEGDWLTFKRALLIVTFCERDERIEWGAWLRSGEDVFCGEGHRQSSLGAASYALVLEGRGRCCVHQFSLLDG